MEVIFRDENQRVFRRVRQTTQSSGGTRLVKRAWHVPRLQILIEPSRPVTLSAVQFFFSRYSLKGPPLSDSYHDWLSQHVEGCHPNHGLVPAIEAIGLAGLSNVYYAPHLGSRARELYVTALAAIQRALGDTSQATADATLMCIVLLALYERVSFESMHQLAVWAKHIRGATALLQLRGNEQFRSPVGITLYLHLRSQIVRSSSSLSAVTLLIRLQFHACIQQCSSIPPALLEVSRCYQSSVIDRCYHDSRPGTLTDASYRLANLRAAIKAESTTDPMALLEEALQIERELKIWRTQITPDLEYTLTHTRDKSGDSFARKRHVYKDLCTAQVWNNWRTLRILTSQIFLKLDKQLSSGIADASLSAGRQASRLRLIHEMSSDICISATFLIGTSRTSTRPDV